MLLCLLSRTQSGRRSSVVSRAQLCVCTGMWGGWFAQTPWCWCVCCRAFHGTASGSVRLPPTLQAPMAHSAGLDLKKEQLKKRITVGAKEESWVSAEEILKGLLRDS